MAEKTVVQENDENLFAVRESVDLTPSNARFFRSGGGLISLELKKDDGSVEFFERVVPVRAFPISEPDEFISVKEPERKDNKKCFEIGMIRKMSDFDEETQRVITEELDKRYFTPEIYKFTGLKEKFGYLYWDAETSAGKFNFVMNNPYSNIRTLEDGRIFMNDIDGNCFMISNPEKLDKASYKRIEIYL